MFVILLYTLKWKLERQILESHRVFNSLHILKFTKSHFRVLHLEIVMSYGVLYLLKTLEVEKV
jgi:hypothetical protein